MFLLAMVNMLLEPKRDKRSEESRVVRGDVGPVPWAAWPTELPVASEETARALVSPGEASWEPGTLVGSLRRCTLLWRLLCGNLPLKKLAKTDKCQSQ